MDQEQSNSRGHLLLLAAATLLAAALRFFKLDAWSLWIDELFTINRALIHYPDLEQIVGTTLVHGFLPLSLASSGPLLHAIGSTEWTSRLIPAVIGVASLPILYFPVSRLFGRRVGLLLSLLLAVSTWHLFWSQNARFYTSLMLFYTLSLLAFFVAIERDRPAYIFLGFFLLYLAMSERLLALWIVPILACYLLLLRIGPFETPPGLRGRNLALMLVLPLGALVLLEVLYLVTTGAGRFLGRGSSSQLDFFLLYTGVPLLKLGVLIGFNIGVALMCFAFFAGLQLVMSRSRAGLFLLVSAGLPVLSLLALNPFVFTKERYVFVTLPSWLILAALGIEGLLAQTKGSGRALALGVLALLICEAVASDILYYRINNGHRNDWRGAYERIERDLAADDVIIAFWPELGRFYLGRDGVPWSEIDADTIVQSGRRHWFVVDSETIWANLPMMSWLEEHGQLIDVKYLRTPADLYLRIYLYDPDRQAIKARATGTAVMR